MEPKGQVDGLLISEQMEGGNGSQVMATDILILLTTAKVFLEMAQSRIIPEGMFVTASILIAFALG